jgi:hypothetical protein
MSTDKVIFQITDADLNTMSPNQLGIETTADATTGYKMLGYKDEDDVLRKVLCKEDISYVDGTAFPAISKRPIFFYNLVEEALYTAVDSTSTTAWIQIS